MANIPVTLLLYRASNLFSIILIYNGPLCRGPLEGIPK